MKNTSTKTKGIFIPNAIAADQSLTWNEKALYSIYHYFTFNGELHQCRLTNESIAQQLGLGSTRKLQRIKSDLKDKGLITVKGISVIALDDFTKATVLTPLEEDSSDTPDMTKLVSKDDSSDIFGDDSSDTHNKEENIDNKEGIKGENKREYGEDCPDIPEVEPQEPIWYCNDSADTPQVAPLPDNNLGIKHDNSVVSSPDTPKYKNRKEFWEAWHRFKAGNDTTDTLQELIDNALYLGINDDLATEYEKNKGKTNNSKSEEDIPWVLMADGTQCDLMLPDYFKLPNEWVPIYDCVYDKSQTYVYVQNASQLLSNCKRERPQCYTSYLIAYVIGLRRLVAKWFPDKDQLNQDAAAISIWNRFSHFHPMDVLCGVKYNPPDSTAQ